MLGTCISVVLTAFAAYPLSRKDFYGRNLFMGVFVFTMFFTGGMIPTFLIVQRLHLLNTMWALILPTAASTYNLIIMRTFFESTIPFELVESASLDGCNDLVIFFRIVLPLSGPILAVMVLFYGVAQWNSWFPALLYISDRGLYPLQMVLREVLIQSDISNMAGSSGDVEIIGDGLKYATMVATPIMCLYPFLQKYCKGVTGAVRDKRVFQPGAQAPWAGARRSSGRWARRLLFGREQNENRISDPDLFSARVGAVYKSSTAVFPISRPQTTASGLTAVFPGLYRRRGYCPTYGLKADIVWKAAPGLSCYTLRHELEWKDRVYADVSFAPLGENARLIRVECCNGTDTPQNLVLHYMASAHDPVPSYRRFALTGAEVRLPEHAAFVLAIDYDDLRFAVSRPTDGLGWDGMRRAEEPVEGFAGGYGVGLGFGCAAGYGPFGQPLPSGAGDACNLYVHAGAAAAEALSVRYIADSAQHSGYRLSSGDGWSCRPCRSRRRALSRWRQRRTLTLTAAGTGGAKLDCFALCEAADSGSVLRHARGACPEMELYEKRAHLKYPHIRECYGVLWDYETCRFGNRKQRAGCFSARNGTRPCFLHAARRWKRTFHQRVSAPHPAGGETVETGLRRCLQRGHAGGSGCAVPGAAGAAREL